MSAKKDAAKGGRKALSVLSSREARRIIDALSEQYGFSDEFLFSMMMTPEKRIYLIHPDIARLMAHENFARMRLDAAGLYFGEIEDDGIRLSIEGSQLIGPKATKNILVIDDSQITAWLRGEELVSDHPRGYVIIRYKDDFVGCGKATGNKVLNYVPKIRRIKEIS